MFIDHSLRRSSSDAACLFCSFLSSSQEALAPLLVSWLAETVKRKTQWAAQLDTVRTTIEGKNLNVDACLIAAATAREAFFDKCRQPAATFSPKQAYAAAMAKSVIAISVSRTSVCGMPAVLFLRHHGGRTPSLSTGKFIVSVSDTGARRRKAELKQLRLAAGVPNAWAISSLDFKTAFQGVRTVMVAELQTELKLQLQLLQIAELHAAKDLGADARTAQNKVVAQQAKVCGILFDRLVAWKDGGFFGLSIDAPSGGWEGMWSRESVLGREKRIPWEGEGASLRDGPADYGCVSIRHPLPCFVPVFARDCSRLHSLPLSCPHGVSYHSLGRTASDVCVALCVSVCMPGAGACTTGCSAASRGQPRSSISFATR